MEEKKRRRLFLRGRPLCFFCFFFSLLSPCIYNHALLHYYVLMYAHSIIIFHPSLPTTTTAIVRHPLLKNVLCILLIVFIIPIIPIVGGWTLFPVLPFVRFAHFRAIQVVEPPPAGGAAWLWRLLLLLNALPIFFMTLLFAATTAFYSKHCALYLWYV